MVFEVSGNAGPKVRPGAVSTATILLYVLAGIILARGALGVLLVVGYGFNPAAVLLQSQQEAKVASSFGLIAAIISGVIYGLLAAGVIVLAVQVGKGRNAARITAWTAAGIFGLCCGCQSISSLAGQAILNSGLDTSGGPSVQDLTTGEPDWITAADTGLAFAVGLLSLAAIVLLALPASNDYFRKEQAVWVPPAYPTGYGQGYGHPSTPPIAPPVDQPSSYPPVDRPASPTSDPTSPPADQPPR